MHPVVEKILSVGTAKRPTIQIALARTLIRKVPRLNKLRNKRCDCGSGKKYKHCHLREIEQKVRQYEPVQHRDIPRSLRMLGFPSALRVVVDEADKLKTVRA